MMLIFFGFLAIVLPSISCLNGPYIHDNYTKYIAANEGDSAKLKCSSNDHTPIKWYKSISPSHGNYQNLTLPNGELSCECGNVLELPSITKDQRGRYVCSVENTAGTSIRYIEVDVQFAPVIVKTSEIHRFERNEIELFCEVISYPPPAITWLKNDKEINPSLQYRISKDFQFDDETNSTLIISTESVHDGIYKCQFANGRGSTKWTFGVYDSASKRERTTREHS